MNVAKIEEKCPIVENKGMKNVGARPISSQYLPRRLLSP
jgi:hypothetical protein